MTKRLLTKKEERIVESRVYRKLYREALNELYTVAYEWLEKRGIKEYDTEYGYRYFTQTGYDPYFDRRVKNTRVRYASDKYPQPCYVSIIKKYYDRSGYDYSGQSAAYWEMGNTDHIFEKAHKILIERNWQDLNDIEYFGYDPNDYI